MVPSEEGESKSLVREYFEALVIAVIFVRFVQAFVTQNFKIPSGSMEDNLKIGDHLVVNKFIFGPGPNFLLPMREIRRGDIIVFRYPVQPETDFVKRVIGLPGETVDIRNKEVFINGVKLDEPYVTHQDPHTYPYPFRDQFHWVVAADQYFVLGDNRDDSRDSRYWGNVPRSMITGRPFMVYWSFRGVPTMADARWQDRAKELVNVVRYFLPRTRWDRMFMIIDKKYHYHAEEPIEGVNELQ